MWRLGSIAVGALSIPCSILFTTFAVSISALLPIPIPIPIPVPVPVTVTIAVAVAVAHTIPLPVSVPISIPTFTLSISLSISFAITGALLSRRAMAGADPIRWLQSLAGFERFAASVRTVVFRHSRRTLNTARLPVAARATAAAAAATAAIVAV